MTLKAYITNLNKYNRGELVGRWIDFPITDDEKEKLEEELNIYIDYNEDGDNYFFTDYDTDSPALYKMLKEHYRLEDLEEIAEALEDIADDDSELFDAILDNSTDLDEALTTYQDNNYHVYYNCYDMGDVAREYCEECGITSQIPEDLRYYFDYDAYGDYLYTMNYFIKLSNSYIEIW